MNELMRRLFFLPPQASSVAREIDTLHYWVLSVTVLGAVGVAIATGVLILRQRRGSARHVQASSVPLWAEVVAIATILGAFLFAWWVGFRQYITLRTPPPDTLDVYVVAKQWMWEFAYPDGSVSNVDLYVPVGTPVRLSMTSRDVIHSFYVPDFRVKQDVVPGRMTVTWFTAVQPGNFDILCAEYCGHSHSLMRGRVIALAPERYEEWKKARRAPSEPALVSVAPLLGAAPAVPRASLAAIGERVAGERGCLRCHTLDGTPHLAPSFAGLYEKDIPLEGGDQVVADPAYLTASMMDPRAQTHFGYQPIMPSYLGVLTAAETAALVELIRSLKDRPKSGRVAPMPAPVNEPLALPIEEPGPGARIGAPGKRPARPKQTKAKEGTP